MPNNEWPPTLEIVFGPGHNPSKTEKFVLGFAPKVKEQEDVSCFPQTNQNEIWTEFWK